MTDDLKINGREIGSVLFVPFSQLLILVDKLKFKFVIFFLLPEQRRQVSLVYRLFLKRIPIRKLRTSMCKMCRETEVHNLASLLSFYHYPSAGLYCYSLLFYSRSR